jgi:small-conductance mechanosensitive channel
MRAAERTLSWLAWIVVVLWVTGVMPAVMEQLDGVRWKIGSTQISLRNMIEGSLTAAVVMVLALWISAALERKIIRGTGDDLSMRKMVSNIVRAVLLFVGLLFAMSAVGIDLTALSVLGGAVGVGLGFGLQKIASNYVSGFIVLLDRSLRIGDVITVDGRRGEVKAIQARYTVIKGGDGVESIIPNEKLITDSVNHHTYSDPKVSLVIGLAISYESDVDRACELLVEAAKKQGRVIADPPSAARVKQLTESGIELELTVWIEDPAAGEGEVRSGVLRQVLRSFKSSGIELARARRDIRVIATAEMPNSSVKTAG